MSEDFSANLRSGCLASHKRPRPEDLDSGGSTGRSGCQYSGCMRVWNQENGTSHRCCSKSHQDFAMHELHNLIENRQAHVTKKPSGTCKLPCCDSPVWVIDSMTGESFDFCRRGHYNEYIEEMCELWALENRLCKIENCRHHVYVDEKTKECGEYCSRECESNAAGARGRSKAAKRKELAVAEGVSSMGQNPMNMEPARDGGKDPSSRDKIFKEAPRRPLQRKMEKERGYHDRIEGAYMMNCLRHLFQNPGDFANADPSGLFSIVSSIADVNPFEDVIGFRPRWYLSMENSTPRKPKPRSTKQWLLHWFKWKQSGNGHKSKIEYLGLTTKYFHYQLTEKGHKDDSVDDSVEAYRKYENEGKLKKGKRNRWRRSQHELSEVDVAELMGGEVPKQIPVISKIMQDKNGLPVWPPIRQEKVNPPLGSIAGATCHVAEQGRTSGVASKASAQGAGLSPGGRTFQGGNLGDSTESDFFSPLQDTAMAVMPDHCSPPVPEAVHVEKTLFSNTSTPAEDVVGQFDITEFLRDMEETADESHALLTGGMASSRSSTTSLGEGFACLNSITNLVDMLDQSPVGTDIKSGNGHDQEQHAYVHNQIWI